MATNAINPMKNSYLRLILITVLSCFYWSGLKAQCPDANVNLTNQLEVDSFLKKFPNCTNFGYSAYISGDIQSLAGFTQFRAIRKLFISSTSLVNLDGLSNLEELDALYINGNNKLNNINAITNIKKVNNLNIDNNSSLLSINGFDSIDTCEIIQITNNLNLVSINIGKQLNKLGDLVFRYNLNLNKIEGFDSIKKIDKTLFMRSLVELQTITAFDNLIEVSGGIVIYDIGMTNLSFLSQLKTTNELTIYENKKLVDLSGLQALQQCGTTIISSNLSLTSINSFQPNNINDLTIAFNPELKAINCFDSLQSIGTLIINDNMILNSIVYSGLPLALNVLRIYNQNNLFNLNSFNIKEVAKELNIQNNLVLKEASSLSRIKGLHGIVYFDNNQSLTNLDFDSLQVTLNPIVLIVTNHALIERISIPNFPNFKLSGLNLRANSELKSFTAPELPSVDYIVIIENKKLSELTSFKNLNIIKSALNISNNASIRDLQFLNKVNTVNNVTIAGNAILQDLKGLDNLVLATSILIEDNDSLKELFSANCLYKSVTNDISIINNDKLSGIDFTYNIIRFNQLNIQENDELTYIKLGEIIASNPIQINITDNANLLEIEANQIQYIKSLNIISNTKLKYLGSYDRLYKIDFLRIELNPALQILSGLDTLVHVIDLSIVQNDNLKSLKEMHELKQINGDLNISNNSNLIELFEDVQKVFKNTNITNNAVLTDISGLRNCNKLANLVLVNNPNLEECAIQSICDALANNAQIFIYNNNTSCKSNNGVKQKCMNRAESIYPNPAHNQLNFFVQPNQNVMHVSIYDLQGRLLQFEDTMQPNIDINGLTNGIYFFEVASEKLNFKQRFVKY